jgi:hypothetical protein
LLRDHLRPSQVIPERRTPADDHLDDIEVNYIDTEKEIESGDIDY